MNLLLSVFTVVVVVASAGVVPHGDLPMQNPDLFEGDILGIKNAEERNAIVNRNQLWPGGVVPYVIDYSLSIQRGKIIAAMNQYHARTCIKFKERTTETNYVRMFEGQGCYSYVGNIFRGGQDLSLGNGCIYPGTIVHELGHAIGFFHEQNRSDRDDYLIIYWDNIQRGMLLFYSNYILE
ncbi:astacin-like [Limulus polyphemus]|uniref:Metalloendopeptidase n=1 Tax=Limulus polyphemus TaxID=6850 RepID=A0ABM1BYX9_LIMPO|nr:astacin-like [Limulus polyphemus]